MKDKESVRSAWSRTVAESRADPAWGRGAEKLRALQPYRDAGTIFASPEKSLQQVRINCLVDGKNLVMPYPSIREGFFFLPARTVPFRDLAAAVSYKGLAKHGQLLKGAAVSELSVDLLLTGSTAVDPSGGRIGDGNGFFDLCCALLQEFNALQQGWSALTFILEEQISREPLPQDPWDIKISGAVTPAATHAFNPPLHKPRILWDQLSTDRIRRIDPLWKLYSAKQKR